MLIMRYLNTIWELNVSDIYTLIYIILAMCGRWVSEMAHLLYEQFTGSDSERTTALLNDNPIKMKFHNYRELVGLWIDYKILKSALKSFDRPEYYPTRERLLEVLMAYFSSRGNEKGSGFEELIGRLKFSCEQTSFKHLGHISLLELLTSDSDEKFFESDDFRRNKAIQQIVQDNIYRFIEQTNVTELQPFMVKAELLTYYDQLELLKRSDGSNYLITDLLDTKGHRGYILFFECLKDSGNRHAGHLDVIKVIQSGLKLKGLHIGKCTDNEEVPL